jgi:hypothetical protein
VLACAAVDVIPNALQGFGAKTVKGFAAHDITHEKASKQSTTATINRPDASWRRVRSMLAAYWLPDWRIVRLNFMLVG